ncbi:MAG TPA: alpha/beta hydrolase [Candidatus Dormibacteraeota bacterium]|nr:alpha/beta hydrolase [Candidatus Dormibacteraeota bacterium]
MIRERRGSLPSFDGVWISWRAWEAPEPRGVLLIVHGLGEHSGRYRNLAEAMVPAGWSCWALDLRGMGESEGPRGHIDSWSQWVGDIAAFDRLVRTEASPLEVVPLGHSFGGVVVASAIVQGALKPRRFVLSNPAFSVRTPIAPWKLALGRIASRTMPTLTMSNGLDAKGISRDAAVVEAYRQDPLVHDRISARLHAEWQAAGASTMQGAPRCTLPMLLLLSDQDPIIDAQAGEGFGRTCGGKVTIKRYPGRYHEPFNDLGAEAVFEDLRGWLDAPVL